jgi:serralysin
MIQKAGAGGTVNLLADHGAYNLMGSITIKHGGADGAPVTIQGVNSDGSFANITINGSRDPNWTSASSADGNTIFKLYAGASNLDFEHMNFNNVGMAFNIGADLRNVTFGNMHADNVRYFTGNYPAGGSSTANVTGLTLHDIDVHGFSKSVLILKGNANDIHVDNVYGDGEYQDGDSFEMGISLQGTVHDVTISNTTMMNCIAVGATGDYTNGDGFTSERGTYNISYINCTATGNGDGGFDLKSSNTTLTNCYSEDNKRNYRIWGDNVTLNNDVGVDPHKHVSGVSGTQCNIWISSEASNVVVNGGFFVDSGSATHAISNEGGGLALNGVTIVHASGATLLDGSSHTTGLDWSLVTSVAATGSYSTSGEQYLAPTATDSTGSDGGSSTGTDTGVGTDGGSVQTPASANDLPTNVWSGTSLADAYHASDAYNWTLNGGDGNDILTGGAGDDSLIGGTGRDVLVGGIGNDTLTGGADNDIYKVDNSSDVIVENAGEGVDFVQASASFTLSANVDRMYLVGSANIDGTGNDLANLLVGNSGANALSGLGANDRLYGGGGGDTLNGGDGNDYLEGGAGQDDLLGGAGRDYFVFRDGDFGGATAATGDRIEDFAAGDRISLSPVDANSGLSGNQAFDFIGTGAFDGHAGELRYEQVSGDTYLSGDTNGDGIADFMIKLDGLHTLTNSDLLL